MLIRHPGDYVLVGDVDREYLSSVTGHRHLRRMMPESSIPDGFTEVGAIRNHTVYGEDGLLKPEYWLLPRVV